MNSLFTVKNLEGGNIDTAIEVVQRLCVVVYFFYTRKKINVVSLYKNVQIPEGKVKTL